MIALQAVIVAVWAAVVYLAFLRPDNPTELAGITADGQGHVSTPPGTNHAPHGAGKPNRHKNHGKPQRDHKPNRDRGGKGGKDGTGGSTGGSTGGGSGANGGNGSPPAPPAAGGETPGGSQYVDTVSTIRARLATGGG